MKVLFVSNDSALFDPASAVRARMRAYAALVTELHVVSRGPVGAQQVQEGALYLHPVGGGRLLSFMRLESKTRALITKYAIDLVSAQDPFEHGRVALRAVRGTGAKLHVQVHTDFLSTWFVRSGGFRSPQVRMPAMNQVRRRIADEVLPHAHGIRVVSERIRTSLVERYGDRIVDPVVIPIAVPATLPPSVPLPPHSFSFALMTVSRLEPEKRIADILYALARIHFRYPGVGLFVVGDGSRKHALMELTRKLGLTEKVVFLGERSDAVGLMQSAQCYIQASAYEGYGRTLLEAALARLPIITTDVGIVGEVFKGYRDVLSVPVADPTALSVQISGLVQDHQARELLAREAQQTARAHIEAVGDVPSRIAKHLSETLGKA
ncbi:MAG TPA: glycosyltransferase [Candidatus Paceibacterota bacterium]|nr:glycosyltransferase [Candidatus Paceibacterota bacterium]